MLGYGKAEQQIAGIHLRLRSRAFVFEAGDDGDGSTKLHWSRIGRHGSRVTITWDIPPDVRPGWYCVRYAGTARDGTRTDFVGATQEFAVD